MAPSRRRHGPVPRVLAMRTDLWPRCLGVLDGQQTGLSQSTSGRAGRPGELEGQERDRVWSHLELLASSRQHHEHVIWKVTSSEPRLPNSIGLGGFCTFTQFLLGTVKPTQYVSVPGLKTSVPFGPT